jgi:IS4 transposase
MLFAQLSGANGLRPLEAAFNHHQRHHYHLGVKEIRRSTVADANENRAETVFADTVAYLMGKVGRKLRQESREFMYLLDSTSITLKGREFDRWTKSDRTRNTQGIKLHMLLDAKSEAPIWQAMSAANVNDISQAQTMPLETGGTYVFDKGYCDFNWWHRIACSGSVFVTRFKKNCALEIIEQREIPEQAQGVVLADQVVRFANKRPGGGRINRFDQPLRRIEIYRPDQAKPLVLATNDLNSPALDIANQYKARWTIELFFKWIKQNLEVKQFFGRSENAVRIQILTALITYLLVALHRQRCCAHLTMSECLNIVRTALFSRPDAEESSYGRRRRETDEIAQRQGTLFGEHVK